MAVKGQSRKKCKEVHFYLKGPLGQIEARRSDFGLRGCPRIDVRDLVNGLVWGKLKGCPPPSLEGKLQALGGGRGLGETTKTFWVCLWFYQTYIKSVKSNNNAN